MSDEKKSEPSFQSIPIERIDSAPFQIRQTIDEDALRELASSMQHVGLLQPIVGRAKGERFEIVAGERRFRAAKLLGRASIPCRVEELSDLDAAFRQVIENDQRVDANPLERARAFAHLRDAFQLGQDQIAMRVGVDKSVVSRMLALLEQPKAIQQMLADERLSPTHLRSLAEIPDESKRIEVAAEVAKHGLSTRETKERAHKVAKTVKAKTRDGEETTWLDEVSDWIGRVHKALGELKVVWHFLKSVLDLLGRLIPGHGRAPKKRFAARSASPRPELPAETEVHEHAQEPSPPPA
jgi:ParB family transcriptional regulator, chromosome partitioning protein